MVPQTHLPGAYWRTFTSVVLSRVETSCMFRSLSTGGDLCHVSCVYDPCREPCDRKDLVPNYAIKEASAWFLERSVFRRLDGVAGCCLGRLCAYPGNEQFRLAIRHLVSFKMSQAPMGIRRIEQRGAPRPLSRISMCIQMEVDQVVCIRHAGGFAVAALTKRRSARTRLVQCLLVFLSALCGYPHG